MFGIFRYVFKTIDSLVSPRTGATRYYLPAALFLTVVVYAQLMSSSPVLAEVAEVQTADVALYEFIEINLTGPDSQGMGSPNPFLIDVFVTFTGPQGQAFVVPAYYDGNGSGAMDGNVWRVRFTPDEVGSWTYLSSSNEPLLNGQSGTFVTGEAGDCPTYTPAGLTNFSCVGRLEHVGSHYLKFSDGPYWLKGGVNEPEDFLAAPKTAGFISKGAAVDYLVSKGVNSMYLLMSNIDGDGKNVWPWVGATQAEAKNNPNRFDISKLNDWENLFRYIQSQGLVLHLVFEDDSAWNGFNRYLFYREMIARFGHHTGLYWNLAEEYNETYTPDEIKAFAQLFRDIEPYGSPLTVHNVGGLSRWDAFVGDQNFSLTSFQTTHTVLNPVAASWFYKVENSGWTIPTSFDESTRNLGALQRDLFRFITWSLYMGGANTELFVNLDISTPSYQSYALQFEDLTRARLFMEGLPYWEMRPENGLVVSGEGYVFFKANEVYSVYLPNGGSIGLNLSGAAGAYNGSWFNPRDGSAQTIGTIAGGSVQNFTAPDTEDWVLLLDAGPSITSTPTSTATNSPTTGPSPTPTETLTPSPSPSPTETMTSSPSPTPTDTPTSGPSPTPTDTLTPSPTPTFTATPTNSATPLPPTNTPTPTATSEITALFSDDFNRPDSPGLGNNWVELEPSGGEVGVQAGAMCFIETSDLVLRPLVRVDFPTVSSGEIRWDFDFNWKRTGDETTYLLFMQLGQGDLMSDGNRDTGVGVNLVWTRIGRIHESFGYRDDKNHKNLGVLSGPHTVGVLANLDTKTYEVSLDGVAVKTGIPFDNPVNLNTIRFFTDRLSEVSHTGRCFDDILVQTLEGGN